ncbi:EBDP2-like protein [Cordyceps javanica]|uniref:EBDP2-like protein n=1 Tax=Cordyceps javanica TaxID=43265 RepID=A0A545VND4_9HYPO|nr:EBDP2-like protein [Cordyceps javanica]TQW03186.1 EBDP2-like protein [Cordyceps javanica]
MASHPYYPLDAVLPGYEPNAVALHTVLALFGGIAGTVVLVAYAAASRQQPALRSLDCFAAAWFALCAFLHLCFEGYFIYFKGELVSQHTLFAMLWKEYALSDSRYLTGDLFTLCIETITVVRIPPSAYFSPAFAWGPLSLFTTLAIIFRSPSRHFLQVLICMAHLYGVLLYYSTNWVDYRFSGISYSRPEFLYYWVYYVGFNAPWFFVPLGLLYDSWSQITSAIVFQRNAQVAAKRE